MPQRIQLSRSRGWKLPPNTVNCARPGKWGNPFIVGKLFEVTDDLRPTLERITRDEHGDDFANLTQQFKYTALDDEAAVRCYSLWLPEQPHLMAALDELRGRDLACWCAVDAPWCHLNVLLPLANQ